LRGPKKFNLDAITPDEPLAARLARILHGYAESLSPEEFDFFSSLSVFPNGVSVEILRYLIDAGGEVAGAMVGFDDSRLLIIAGRLKKTGLIYAYGKGNAIIYTAHPFLRDYFKVRLNEKKKESMK